MDEVVRHTAPALLSGDRPTRSDSVKLFAVLAVLSLLAAPAAAQTPPADAPRTGILREAIAAAGAAQAPAASPRRDSVLNGAVIGAVAGGAALAVIGGVICNLLHEEGNPPCWRGTLAVGAVGAGIGAAAGAGIDAMISTTALSPPTFGSARPERRAVVINWRQRF
jgi:hypothetical protein